MSVMGDRLKELRNEKRRTLAQMSKETGLTATAISNYENDIRKPGVETMDLLSDYFNVDLDYLRGKTDVKSVYGFDGIYKKGFEAGVATMSAITQVPIYDPISCGTGSWVDEYPDDFIGLPNGYLNTSLPLFANESQGDSMSPGIEPGDLVIFGETDELQSGQIGAFGLNDEFFCKRYRNFNGDIWLYSDNTEYEPIHVTPEDNFRILGVLKAVVSKR